MTHRLTALVCISTLLIFALSSSAAGAQRQPPNIVLILADDLGNGDLSCQGAKDMRTPHIDKLFAAGMQMTRFYANSSVCSPTRAALLTGRYPELVGVPGVIRTHTRNSWGFLSPEALLLPTVLKSAGYHTAIIGKWHLGLSGKNRPTKRGFDFFHGFLGDMMDDYYHHRRHKINYMRQGTKTIDPKGHATDLFSKWAVDYIHQQSKKKQPFFLYLAYNAPHSPIQPPPAWLAKVKKRQKNIPEKRAKLVALIEHMDHGIGQVVAALKKTSVYENTLIIVTSDNGGALHFGAANGPLRDGKGSMYEGGLRVPMCAVWAGRIKPHSRCAAVGITMDLFTTSCAAAGIDLKHKVEGVSLLPLLLGKKKELPPRDLFFIRREGGRYKGRTIHALRRGKWKLVQNRPGGKFELFDLKADPLEKKELSQARREIFHQLSETLRGHIRRGEAVNWRSPEKRKKTESLQSISVLGSPRDVHSGIKSVLREQAKAWNNGDIATFMKYYWKSKSLTFTSGGKTTRGWKKTLANYKKRYPTRAKMGTLTFDKLEISVLGKDAALVLGRWHLKRRHDRLEGRFSLVFRRIDGRWLIVHDHTSRAMQPS